MELRNRSKPISTPIHGHNIYRWVHVYDQESFAVNRSRILFFLFDFFFFGFMALFGFANTNMSHI